MGRSYKKRSGIFNTRRRYKQTAGFSFEDTQFTDMGDSLPRSSRRALQYKSRIIEKLSRRTTVYITYLFCSIYFLIFYFNNNLLIYYIRQYIISLL